MSHGFAKVTFEVRRNHGGAKWGRYISFHKEIPLYAHGYNVIHTITTFEFVTSDAQLETTIIDLVFASTENLQNNVAWAVFLLIKFPHVQTKCRQEIFSVRHKNRQISISHDTLRKRKLSCNKTSV